MPDIATLNAILRLDARQFKRGVKETEGSLGKLQSGFNKSAASAEKFGAALAERFIGAAALISLATVAVDKFAESWKNAQLNAGKSGVDQGRGGIGGFLDGFRDLLEGIPLYGSIVKLGGSIRAWADGSADEMKRLNEELARFPELEKRLNDRITAGRAKRQLLAETQDTISGNDSATRALALSRADAELARLKFVIDDIVKAQKEMPRSIRGVEVPGIRGVRPGGNPTTDVDAVRLLERISQQLSDGLEIRAR